LKTVAISMLLVVDAKLK